MIIHILQLFLLLYNMVYWLCLTTTYPCTTAYIDKGLPAEISSVQPKYFMRPQRGLKHTIPKWCETQNTEHISTTQK